MFSEDPLSLVSCTVISSSRDLYSQHVATESVAATDAMTRSGDDDEYSFSKDDRLLRSSSYEDIYVGTKLPGDEAPDESDDVVDVSNIGDRFDARPASAAFPKQSDGRSSSFENLYEMQGKDAAFAEERVVDDGADAAGMQQWQFRDNYDDPYDRDSVLAPVSSVIGESWSSTPIDITVESGLDQVGQSTGYGGSAVVKRSPHLLQHSMSYDLEPGKIHRRIGSGSSLDGNDDDGVDFPRGRNAAAGIRNGRRCTECVCMCVCVLVAAFDVVVRVKYGALLSVHCTAGEPLY